jgi:alanyl-tRNA synthetase
VEGKSVQSASFGNQVQVILPKSGFYIEAGGQVSDTGFIRGADWEIEVQDVRKPSTGIIVHIGEVIAGQPGVGDPCAAEVDQNRRHDIMRNHTATHLMHAALHKVLGEHARQAGSLVAPDRLRFDFNHPEAMTHEQLERVERIVNEAVAADLEVAPKLKSREEAIAEGAMALFGEKYGETVRTMTIGNPEDRYSYELCGGTHLERTSDVGAFLIVSEGSAAAGVRRIEAVTGRGAYDLIARRFKAARQAAALVSSTPEELPAKVESLQDELTDVRKQLASLRQDSALVTFGQKLQEVETVKDVKVLAVEIPNCDAEALRALSDKFREKHPKQGVCVLASVVDGKSTVIATVTEDLVKRGLKAGDLITAIGGKGGGRPNLAQGSLPDPSKASEVLRKVAKAVEVKLK